LPQTRGQRCWVHKTANVLNKVALSVQVNMMADLREIYGAPTRAAAEAAIDVFADKYGAKYDKEAACLIKDRDALLAFFDFPAEHWDHLRTSNPIESVFATVRHFAGFGMVSQQLVRVEHVHISGGGKAIVGNVKSAA
jgi:putative transposase